MAAVPLFSFDILQDNSDMPKSIIIARFDDNQYIRAMRRAAREQEIEMHGRQAELRPMKHSNKKAYSRKQKYAICLEEYM